MEASTEQSEGAQSNVEIVQDPELSHHIESLGHFTTQELLIMAKTEGLRGKYYTAVLEVAFQQGLVGPQEALSEICEELASNPSLSQDTAERFLELLLITQRVPNIDTRLSCISKIINRFPTITFNREKCEAFLDALASDNSQRGIAMWRIINYFAQDPEMANYMFDVLMKKKDNFQVFFGFAQGFINKAVLTRSQIEEVYRYGKTIYEQHPNMLTEYIHFLEVLVQNNSVDGMILEDIYFFIVPTKSGIMLSLIRYILRSPSVSVNIGSEIIRDYDDRTQDRSLVADYYNILLDNKLISVEVARKLWDTSRHKYNPQFLDKYQIGYRLLQNPSVATSPLADEIIAFYEQNMPVGERKDRLIGELHQKVRNEQEKLGTEAIKPGIQDAVGAAMQS